MSVYQGPWNWTERRDWKRSGHGAWKPLELGAMIAGFALFWPVGLGVLIAKIGQRRERYEGDLFSYMRDKVMGGLPSDWRSAGERWTSSWGVGGGFGGMGSTGNLAFDEWRKAELDRLEAERRKLADAEREFAEHLERLRRARDREEFDRFMAEREGRNGTTSV